MDSEASEYMTGDRAWFDSLQPLASTVRIATAGVTSLAADSAGPVSLANHRGERVVLGRVLLVPGLAFNLLSVSRLDSVGAEIVFGNSLSRVSKGGVEVLRADQGAKSVGGQGITMEIWNSSARGYGPSSSCNHRANLESACLTRHLAIEDEGAMGPLASEARSPQVRLNETSLWWAMHWQLNRKGGFPE